MSGSTRDPQCWSVGPKTHAAATGSVVVAATQRAFLTGIILSASGTIAAAVRATLTWKKGGATQTMGILMGTTLARPIVLNFSRRPLEADPGTTVALSIPDLGVAGSGEACLLGYLEDQ
jgi:hypothetical protein